MYPCHTWIRFKEFSHALGVAAMLLHAQVQGFESEVEQEGILGCGYAAEVTHQLADEFGEIGFLAEGLRVGEPVV